MIAEESMIILTNAHLQRICLPQNYYLCSIDQIPVRCPHKKVIQRYINNIGVNIAEGYGLLLWGDYGSGKSGLGSIILKAAAANGYLGLWIRANNIADYLINKTRFDVRETMIERAIDVPILVIDELIIRETVRASDTFFEDLIRQRINEKQSTVVTTNLSPDAISSRYPALAAVMKEAILAVPVSGHNFRTQLAEQVKKELTE
jgi:DNA replication protein DnaC